MVAQNMICTCGNIICLRHSLTLSAAIVIKIPVTLHTICQRRLDPIHIVTNNVKWVKTSWTDGMYASYIDINIGKMTRI